jgi:sugar phosphate isomerase/epimerase
MSLKSLLTTVALATLAAPLFAANPIPDAHRINGIAIGVQAYSFNRFTLFEAIEKTEQTGGKTIEFYPRQKLSKEQPAVTFNHDAPDDLIQLVQDKLKKHGIKAVNYGVVAIPKDEAEARKIFEFARKMNLYGITTESTDSIDTIETLVKEFDLKVGFHEHGRKPNDPNYKIWDPHFVLSVVKDRDARIGACADTGHWQTSGLNPVYCLRVLKGRIVSLHLKDKTDFGPGAHDVPYGTGVGDIKRCLEELKGQKFDGHISVEYEYNWDNSVPDIKQCIDFVRDWSAANK